MILDTARKALGIQRRTTAVIVPSTLTLPAYGAATPSTSTTIPAVYSAVNMIADAFAAIPWDAYRGNVPQDPPPAILRRPDPFDPLYTTRQEMALALLLRGNAYAYLTAPDRSGRPTVAIPIPGDEVTISWNDARTQPVYRWRGQRMILNESILHIPMMRGPGELYGIGPVEASRLALTTAIAEDRLAADSAINGGVPDGVVTVPGKLTQPEADLIREGWDTRHAGKRGVAFLTGGMAWTSTRMSNADMQFLESREFNIRDIARMFRIPAALLNAQNAGNSMVYRNLEGIWTEFTRTAVEPIAERFEAAFGELLPSTREIRHDYQRLLRADVQTRYNTYAIARQNGILTSNEIRESEGLDPVEGGDRLDFRTEEVTANIDVGATGDPDIAEAAVDGF